MAEPRRISNADWQKHKSAICRLYKDENMPMANLIEEMSREHGFNASKPQYMRQFKVWGVQKNQKGEFWKDVSLTLKRKNLKVDDVDVFLNGELVPIKRLKRQLTRNDLPTLIPTTARPRTPEGIFIRPKTQIPRRLIISLPWHQICTRLEIARSTLARRKVLSPSPLLSPVLDITDGLLGLGDDDCWKYGALGLPLETGMDRILPSLGFVDQHREQKESRDGYIVDAGIAGLLDLSPWCTSRESFAQSMAQIARYVPERYLRETENVANQLLDPDSTTRMQVFMSFVALMLANNLLEEHQVDAFVIALDEMAGPSAFEMLSLRDNLSTRAIMSELVFAAVRLDKPRLVKNAIKNGVDVNCRSTGSWSRTLIAEAVLLERIRIVEMLVDAGADVAPESMSRLPRHDYDCPLVLESSDCTTSEDYQCPGVYCDCEMVSIWGNCAIRRATTSRRADELIPLLLRSQVSTPSGPLIVNAIRHGVSRETIEMLLRMGASVNECELPKSHWWEDNNYHQGCTPLCAAARSGDNEMARLLLDYGANPNGPVTWGYESIFMTKVCAKGLYKSPLVLATECGNLDMVQLLIERGADPNWSTLDILEERRREEVIRGLEDEGCGYVDEYTRVVVHLPLQAAAGLEDSTITEYLLSKGAAANPRHGTPPLSIAAYHGRDATVDLLIRWGAMINPAYTEGCSLSPLEGAVCSGSESMVQRMISAGADLDWCSSGRWGGSALQRAAERGFGAIFDMLRRAGATLDSSSTPNHATTILQTFVKHHDYERSLALLQDGVSPNGKCKDGSSPLIAAILSQDVRFMSLLLEWGADANDAYPMPTQDEKLMFHHVRHDIQAMLTCPKYALPPIHWAVVAGNLDAVVQLRNAGADVNETDLIEGDPEDVFGLTALHLAVKFKHKNIVEFLLAEGADVNTIFDYGPWHQPVSPVIISVANSDLEITSILLEHGADPYLGQSCNNDTQEDQRLRSGNTALEEACLRPDMEMVRLLISSGVDARVGCPLYFTLCFGSVVDQSVEMMELLLAAGVDVNRRAANLETPLQAALSWATRRQAVRAVGFQCARRLIVMGADINALPACASYGRTALQAAVEIGDVDFVQYLLSRGAEINAPAASDSGVTALQAAAIHGYFGIAQILLERGAEIDADPSPRNGRRAIDGAAEHGRIDMVKLLLDNYDGPRPISKVCESAMEYAEKENQWHVVELLESYTPPQR